MEQGSLSNNPKIKKELMSTQHNIGELVGGLRFRLKASLGHYLSP